MKTKWTDPETAQRLVLDMTAVHRFRGEPEVVTGNHPQLGFVVLIRCGDRQCLLMDDRGSACASEPQAGKAGSAAG